MPNAPKMHRPPGWTPRQQADRQRGSAQERGFDKRWAKEKRLFIDREIGSTGNTKCRYCQHNEITLVEHIWPPLRLHRIGSPEYFRLFWDMRYWVGACNRCNTLKGQLLPHELKVSKHPELRLIYSRIVEILTARGVPLICPDFVIRT